MNIKSKIISLCFFCILGSQTNVALAAFVNVGVGAVQDTESGLFWATNSTSNLANLSFDQQLAEIVLWNEEGRYGSSEWRVATADDIATLWSYTGEQIDRVFSDTWYYEWERSADWGMSGRIDTAQSWGFNCGSWWDSSGDSGYGCEVPPTSITSLITTEATSSMGMWVVSTSYIPVPAAVWLFGSGLIGLIAVAKRKV